MNSKADANMWWIIIGAVIALVVLIVLMVIFTTKTGRLEGGLSDCEGKSGICATSTDTCPGGTLSTSAFDCKSGYKCCLGSPKMYKAGADGCEGSVTDSNGKQWCK